jgi:hypothetical protein
MEEFFKKIGAQITVDEYEKCTKMPSDATSITTSYVNMIGEIHPDGRRYVYFMRTQQTRAYSGDSKSNDTTDKIDTWPYVPDFLSDSYVRDGAEKKLKSVEQPKNRELEMYKHYEKGPGNFTFMCIRTHPKS